MRLNAVVTKLMLSASGLALMSWVTTLTARATKAVALAEKKTPAAMSTNTDGAVMSATPAVRAQSQATAMADETPLLDAVDPANIFKITDEPVAEGKLPLWEEILIAIVATVIFMYSFRFIRDFFNRLSFGLTQYKGTAIRALKVHRLEVLSVDQVTTILVSILHALSLILRGVLIYFYLTIVFGAFPVTRWIADLLMSYVASVASFVWQGFVDFLPSMMAITTIILLTIVSLRVIRFVTDAISHRQITIKGFYYEWAKPTYKIMRFMVIILSLVMIAPYLPWFDSPAFKGISIFLGVLFSLGSSSAVANVVAGVVLVYMRPFKIGDRIEAGNVTGDVIEMSILVTRIRTIKNVSVTIPNSNILSGAIYNYSTQAKGKGLILHTKITIGYDVPWPQVHQLMLEAANRTEHVEAEPPPFILQTALDDFYVEYELNAYTKTPNVMTQIYSDLHQNIQDTFNEVGVEIMSPHYRANRDGNALAIPAKS